MWSDQVSNPGPLTYESGALPTALHGPASRYGSQIRVGYDLPKSFVFHFAMDCTSLHIHA